MSLECSSQPDPWEKVKLTESDVAFNLAGESLYQTTAAVAIEFENASAGMFGQTFVVRSCGERAVSISINGGFRKQTSHKGNNETSLLERMKGDVHMRYLAFLVANAEFLGRYYR